MGVPVNLIDHLVDTDTGQVKFLAAELYLNGLKDCWDVKKIQNAHFAEGMSAKYIQDLLVKEFGTLKITKDQLYIANQQSTTLSLREFQKIYEFAKFPDVRDWLLYLDKMYGHTIKLEELYLYVLRSTGEEFKFKDTRVKYRANVY